MNFFRMGFRSVLPIIPGIIPFGAVMGSAFAEANLSFWQAMLMNTTVYAGAAQLATTDLMKMNAAIFVVVATGLIINLRFLLYSAAMSPFLRDSGPLVKFICAFTLTDQSYAAMTGNLDKINTNTEATHYYLGTAACMLLTWHSSVIAGFVFGNFAPASLSLDFAIPLSFVALLVPTLKRKDHKAVALFSSVVSLLFYNLPLKTGLMLTALLSIGLAWIIIQKKSKA
ncbi:MAG TPA: AzlC family ABC transporter permease [Bacteriovoracaceae bacterium]|nr:AzlC family ABC transporter permease [Bacteriovoracaceae bacterium]